MLAAVTAAAETTPASAPSPAGDLARRGRHSDPVVQYFSIVSDRSAGSNLKLKCLFCNKEFKGSATRMRAHLAGSKDGVAACPSVPDDVKASCVAELQAKREAKARMAPTTEGQPPATSGRGGKSASAGGAAATTGHSKAEWEFLEKHYLVLGCSSAGNRSLRCHHCGKEFKGSATRMRAHLAGSRDGVAPCPLAPPEVKAACLEAVKGRQTAKAFQTRALEEDPNAPNKKQKTEGDGTGSKGRQSDPVVKHFQIMSDRSARSNLSLKCLYCQKEFKGSATRMRGHLAGSRDGVSACKSVPENIRAEFLAEVKDKQSFKARLAQQMAEVQALPGLVGAPGGAAATPQATPTKGAAAVAASPAAAVAASPGPQSASKTEGLDKHFEVTGVANNGNRSLRCIHCNKTFQGSATRMRAHLAGSRNGISACPNVPSDVKEACLKVIQTKRAAGVLQNGAAASPAAAGGVPMVPPLLGDGISAVPAPLSITSLPDMPLPF